MSIPADPAPEPQRSHRRERGWFRLWLTVLVLLFAIVGATQAWRQLRTKRDERRQATQLLDPQAPDPGVTAAAASSTAASVPVSIGIYLERIPELSVKDATWTAVFDLWFRWEGGDLKPAEGFVIMEGEIVSKEKLAEVHGATTHYERYRVVAKITKHFPVARFPLDEHLLTIAVENGELVREKMVFIPDKESSSVSSRVKAPGYRLAGWQALEKAHSYKTTRGDPRLVAGTKSTYSQFRVGVTLTRDGPGLYLKMFQALYVAVGIALLACFIKPTDVDPRFGLGVGALFAAVANAYLVGSYVPDTGEFALADVVNGLGIFTILITLIESTVSLYLYDRCGEEALSQRLDRLSFRIILAGFLVANALLILAAWG